jgi:2-keto-4-pentenoate hydratase/2-oxohepta-3-ene-1,7-dioic acid hydratase in catechol pathway
MRVLTFHQAGALRLGLATDAGILDVAAAAQALGLPEASFTPAAFTAAGLDALPALATLLERAQAAGQPLLHDVEPGPPIPAPGKIICIGLNYRRHAEETGAAIPTSPIVFSKFSNTIAAHGDEIPLPKRSAQVDYEAELVVVIGRRAVDVSEADALSVVLGYTNGNDLSARDLQLRTSQWLLGKTPDHFFPFGPILFTADEVPDPQALTVRGWLNGEPRQNSNTADMIFSCAQIISYLSQHMTLEPGDVIATGTPEGVILGMKEKRWLAPGDEYVIEIGPFGQLSNRMVASS